MKSNYYFLALLVVMGTFTACEPSENLPDPNDSNLDNSLSKDVPTTSKQQETEVPVYFMNLLNAYKEVNINTYTIKFLERTVSGVGGEAKTTFKYEVRGNGETPQLDSFSLELPECSGTLSAWSPQQSSKLFEDQIKWTRSVSSSGSENYSVTFNGVIPLGIISSTVTRGSNIETKTVVGPCAGVYTLSGSIYIDANENGNKDLEETGIAFIPIDLYNSDTGVKFGSVFTTVNGLYSFKVLEGNYKISVGSDLLNDSNYTAVGDPYIEISNVTQDIAGYNFGYLLNSSKVITELENKVIGVNTEPTKFWISVIKGTGPNKNLYSKSEINAFLTEIEELHLNGPFYLGNNMQTAALEILSRPIKTDLDAFLQQLLTAELNVVSGRGALLENGELDNQFNDALLIYAEAVACRETGNCPINSSKALRSNDTRLLTSFNGSGGI